MTKLNIGKIACAVMTLCAVVASGASAQTFNTILQFNGDNGSGPYGLTQGGDGNFYGTTVSGGGPACPVNKSCGTVFKITATGTLTQLHRFVGRDGAVPEGPVQATDGNFYGITSYGGASETCFHRYGCGTVFTITPGGVLATLYSFCAQTNCVDGWDPLAGLVQATDGNFYGTTGNGGTMNRGTAFKITPGGVLTTLHSFDGTHGSDPTGALIQASDGNLYGTTQGGGHPTCGSPSGCGTVFRITPGGVLTTLYGFCAQTNCVDGWGPLTGLVQAADGNLYGTAFYGGADGTCLGGLGCGTVFRITPGGVLATLYSFCAQTNCVDGSGPRVIVQATDGNFYGTTDYGGTMDSGTVFQLTPEGTLTTLHSFCSQPGCTDGAYPGTLMQATDGNFYGTTGGGGTTGSGTAFSLSMGLGPFVKTLPAAGKTGAKVGILGNNLTGATGVTFNGIPAQFSVPLPSLILTHVPTGATTGTIRATTPSGTLTSNVPFHVIP
jgi:uncharacterized repeat protein (TIGR03803 family)